MQDAIADVDLDDIYKQAVLLQALQAKQKVLPAGDALNLIQIGVMAGEVLPSWHLAA